MTTGLATPPVVPVVIEIPPLFSSSSPPKTPWTETDCATGAGLLMMMGPLEAPAPALPPKPPPRPVSATER